MEGTALRILDSQRPQGREGGRERVAGPAGGLLSMGPIEGPSQDCAHRGLQTHKNASISLKIDKDESSPRAMAAVMLAHGWPSVDSF